MKALNSFVAMAFIFTCFCAFCEVTASSQHQAIPSKERLENSSDPAVKKSTSNVCYPKLMSGIGKLINSSHSNQWMSVVAVVDVRPKLQSTTKPKVNLCRMN
jgi:hypothetical protein